MLQLVVLATKVEGSLVREAQPDDLEGLFQPVDRLGEVEPVGLNVLPFPSPNPQNRWALGEVSQGQHGLGKEHGVAANRIRDADAKAKSTRTSGESAQEHLVVEQLVGALTAGRGPRERLLPKNGGNEPLPVIDHPQ